MIEAPWLDWVGWGGFVTLGAFYFLLGSGKVVPAYVFSLTSSVFWLVIGTAFMLGYAARMPSLIAMEIMVIGLNIRGIYLWRKRKII